MKTISIIWATEDVLMRADELGVKLSEQEADEILDDLLRHHDCQIGICWDTIGVYIHQYETDREESIQDFNATLLQDEQRYVNNQNK